MKGNIGEWSEAYTFLRLLLDGQVASADSDLQPLGHNLKFRKLVRKESAGTSHFFPWEPKFGIDSANLSRNEVEDALSDFRQVVRGGRKLGSFEMPGMARILHQLSLTELKASSRTKTDLFLELEDAPLGQSKLLGFSIKSEVGSPSTLVNAGKHTAFKFEVLGDPKLAQRLSTEMPKSQVSKLLKRFSENSLQLSPVGPKSPFLKENLSFFGTDVPTLLSSLLLGYYQGYGKTIWSLLHNLGYEGPFHDQARYKIGQFLRAAAMGMTPASPWIGFNELHGGFLVLRKNAEILAVPATNEEGFREYLLKHTYFDTPSTPRHKFGFVYFEEGVPYLDLVLQIRLGGKPNHG